MAPTGVAATPVSNPEPRVQATVLSAPQKRIVAAAYELFGEHGVSETSLQMIAERVGVTKAAVYHQFKTKDEIVLATIATEMVRLERTVDAAEAAPDTARARDELLVAMVDLLVARRQRALLMQNDPAVQRFLDEEPFRSLMRRSYRILTGEDTPQSRARGAMMGAAIGAAVAHPLAAELSDDDLRTELLAFARGALRIIPVNGRPPGGPQATNTGNDS
jgi:AcrR family transcriptional regulator